jgi:hypothetical protein
MTAFMGTPYRKGTTVTFGSEDAEGTIVGIGEEPTTGKPNGWYIVEFSERGKVTTDSMHHSEIDPLVTPRICPACGINPAAAGDRYCADCGSARDRSGWVDGPSDAALRDADRRARNYDDGLIDDNDR